MKFLVTGGAGLVGSECVRLLMRQGHDVISVDNFMRGTIFGKKGDTSRVLDKLISEFPFLKHVVCDVRNVEAMEPLVEQVDAVIHAAAQPSHPRSIDMPVEDFSINAAATLQLLELVRKHNPTTPFVYCSTNKVYGDNPNKIPFEEYKTRFDFAEIDGIDEAFPVDQCLHTPFGVSKLAADMYVQEYGRLYGLKTGVFRMGCVTGSLAQAVEHHNWEPLFVEKCLRGDHLTIYGFGGKQVRDVIHAQDVAQLFLHFIQAPRTGEVYNIGGGRKNSISLLEAITLIESICGRRMKFTFGPERHGDHRVYITDLKKVKSHYPWDVEMGVQDIFNEIYSALCKTIP